MAKTKHYTFTFPVREFAWCYSAKAFEESMRVVCCGRQITAIYVGSKDYGSPLRVTDTYVNYYNFSSILIRLNDCWLDLHVIACGLFRWRTFKLDEVTVASTRFATSVFDCKQDEWCEFGDAYRAFRLEYLNSNIENAAVVATAYRRLCQRREQRRSDGWIGSVSPQEKVTSGVVQKQEKTALNRTVFPESLRY